LRGFMKRLGLLSYWAELTSVKKSKQLISKQ
jgi:hypothetical protein